MDPFDVRYARNIPAISAAEQALLHKKSVLIVGCGGLGGYLLETFCRVGIGQITVVDGDRISPSNLNRQLLATEQTLGVPKVQAARQRAATINKSVKLVPVDAFLDADNAQRLVAGKDLVVDALDNIPSRLLLERTCSRQNVVLVHGAVDGWHIQVAVIPPGSGLLHRIYSPLPHEPAAHSCLPVAPQLCAALQAAQAISLLCGRSASLFSRLFIADLQTMQWDQLHSTQL